MTDNTQDTPDLESSITGRIYPAEVYIPQDAMRNKRARTPDDEAENSVQVKRLRLEGIQQYSLSENAPTGGAEAPASPTSLDTPVEATAPFDTPMDAGAGNLEVGLTTAPFGDAETSASPVPHDTPVEATAPLDTPIDTDAEIPGPLTIEQLQAEVERLKTENTALTKKRKTTHKTSKKLTKKNKELEEKLKVSEKKNEDLQVKYKILKRKHKERKASIRGLFKEIHSLGKTMMSAADKVLDRKPKNKKSKRTMESLQEEPRIAAPEAVGTNLTFRPKADAKMEDM